MNFASKDGLRIWRITGSELYGDEAAKAGAHADKTFAKIAAEGFNAIWIHTLLYSVMNSKLLPQLNDPTANTRLTSLRTVIKRAAKHGIATYLYINDPQAIDGKHRLWTERPELKGHAFPFGAGPHYSLCTALPEVREFVRDAANSVLESLPGLGGVILITACEHPTHCWSKAAIRLGGAPTNCERCRTREPAESVLPIIEAWADAARAQPHPPRILAWNWEWAYWYEDPQSLISTHLPDGVDLLLDNEIGGHTTICGQPRVLREYSLAFVGPSERFEATRAAVAAAGKRNPIHAKIEFNATHEMCSVPNIPVLATIHARLRGMYERDTAGFLGCWSMSSAMTLNTASLRIFLRDPARFADADLMFAELALDYFGETDARGLSRAWRGFSEAWKFYPNALPLLYVGPHNDAPGRRMSLKYEGKQMGRSWQMDEPGDNLSTALGRPGAIDALTIDSVITAYSTMAERWAAALPDYEAALANDRPGITNDQRRHRFEELSTARMIGLQLRSTANAYAFHRERLRIMSERGLTPPCDVPLDVGISHVMEDELNVLSRALPLVDADARLGYHLDCGTYKYSGPMIRLKMEQMRSELAGR